MAQVMRLETVPAKKKKNDGEVKSFAE